MARGLSANVKTELATGNINPVYLVHLGFATPIYLTNCGFPLTSVFLVVQSLILLLVIYDL